MQNIKELVNVAGAHKNGLDWNIMLFYDPEKLGERKRQREREKEREI